MHSDHILRVSFSNLLQACTLGKRFFCVCAFFFSLSPPPPPYTPTPLRWHHLPLFPFPKHVGPMPPWVCMKTLQKMCASHNSSTLPKQTTRVEDCWGLSKTVRRHVLAQPLRTPTSGKVRHSYYLLLSLFIFFIFYFF